MIVGDRTRALLRAVGELLITLGVVVLLFVVYELKFTNLYTEQQQKVLGHQLEQTWARPPAAKTQLTPFRDGEGFARIYLPTLGKKEVHVVVEGVSHEDLKKGPGHVPETSLPGALGNVVISGHRTTYGAPFNRLDELKLGDAIVLETQSYFYTYRVTTSFVVSPSAVGETFAVPNKPGAIPTLRLLTLTTCNPKYSARERLVVRSLLESTLHKGPGVVPPALSPDGGT